MTTRLTLQIAALAACLAPASGAQFLHEGDVILTTNTARTTIVTGSGSNATLTFPFRVFTARFGDSGFANRTTNPGFNAWADATANPPITFYPGQALGITVRRALRKWDGQGFCTIPPEVLRITRSGVSVNTPSADPVGDPAVQTPSLNLNLGFTANGDGFLHEHPSFWLQAPSSNGVYLLEVQSYVGSPTSTSPSPSAPYWILWAQNVDTATIDAATTWVESNVAAGAGRLCPCRADFLGDGALTPADIFGFLTAYFAGDPRTDFNTDGVRTPSDIFAFLNAYFAGCPAS
jgi:hypothetical protein